MRLAHVPSPVPEQPVTAVLPPPTPVESAQALTILAQNCDAVGNKPMAEFYRQAAQTLLSHGDKPGVLAQVLSMPVPQ
jgi:hypothetical protein